MNCIMEGCENALGPKSLEIKHEGVLTSFVCEVCLGSAEGLKVFLKKNEDRQYEISEIVPIANPL